MRQVLIAASFCIVACGGQVVFEDDGSLAAADGRCHAICVCLDGSAALATSPQGSKGSCFNSCDSACAPRGGVRQALGKTEGVGNIAYCDELCQRVDAAACDKTCSQLIGPCEESDGGVCGAQVDSTLACLAQRSTVVCDGDVVRLDGCAAELVGACP